jgi:hypothetical protein
MTSSLSLEGYFQDDSKVSYWKIQEDEEPSRTWLAERAD